MEVSEYINKWITILDEMRNDNTYKLAWGRAIIEVCTEKNIANCKDDDLSISFSEIGIKMLKYYWNQIFYFNLKQSSDNVLNKTPEMVQYTELLINEYKSIFDTSKPEWFNLVFPSVNIKLNQLFKSIINKDIPNTLKSNVSWRFLRVKDQDDIGVYRYDLNAKRIFLTIDEVNQIKEYSRVLTQLFNYKWSLLLEKYNFTPKICNKVRGSGDEDIKRNSLEPYKKILLLQYGENIKDFYTDETISINDVSIDHVIPWSYIYDDNIWNLVITSRSYNSKKSNNLIRDEYIHKLNKRNKELIEFLRNYDKNQYEKQINELQFAVENNTVTEIYHYFRA